MLILIIESAIFAVLTILAINYGSALWLLWLFVLIDGLILAFRIYRKIKKKCYPSADSPKNCRAAPLSSTDSGYTDFADDQPLPHLDETFCYSGRQFEAYVAAIYNRLGYKVIAHKKSCDQGIDIIVKRIFTTGIQAKCYSRPVGNKAVQEAAAGKHFYRLHKVAVITNGIFTDSAKALAAKNKVVLIDRIALAAMVKKANRKYN